MKPLRILITNLAMWSRSGTETHARDLALGLLQRGHKPILYSPRLGAIAREMEAAGVEVVDNLEKLSHPPDLIHGHHNITAMTAILHFPGVPAVFLCHDKLAWHDAPPRFPAIRRYVAVDYLVYGRLVVEHALPREIVSVIGNSVDLERFHPRGPLPAKPQRALLFSNYANKHTHLQAVTDACSFAGIELDVRGAGVNNSCDRPEDVLGNYDLVFGKARCAMEAMAVGAAVVLCGPEGCGRMVTAMGFDYLRRYNFGRHTLTDPVTMENLIAQIGRYNAGDAAQVRTLARTELSAGLMVEQWIKLYQEVLAETPTIPPRPTKTDLEQAAQFLLLLDPILLGIYGRDVKIQSLEGEVRQLKETVAKYAAEEARRAVEEQARLKRRWYLPWSGVHKSRRQS
ncbi:MAG TPA: hypothetical protein VK699_08385 [Terriglobales bacterium]|jgi:glycosyltransferase involved in cell wall biosynthesis|nr:hypothetical protein [Terriglobales bacterium]